MNSGHYARIEKALVDLLVELDSFPIMAKEEFQEMVERLAGSVRVGMAELISYSKHRKVGWEDLFPEKGSIISAVARERS